MKHMLHIPLQVLMGMSQFVTSSTSSEAKATGKHVLLDTWFMVSRIETTSIEEIDYWLIHYVLYAEVWSGLKYKHIEYKFFIILYQYQKGIVHTHYISH